MICCWWDCMSAAIDICMLLYYVCCNLPMYVGLILSLWQFTYICWYYFMSATIYVCMFLFCICSNLSMYVVLILLLFESKVIVVLCAMVFLYDNLGRGTLDISDLDIGNHAKGCLKHRLSWQRSSCHRLHWQRSSCHRQPW